MSTEAIDASRRSETSGRTFQNLLENTVKYSDNDPPRVDGSAERDGDEWVVSVSDNGIGIDPDDADRVFEVSENLHARGGYSGTGIGLALRERIVERHGGDIRVESTPGDGSTFYFTVPAQGEAPTAYPGHSANFRWNATSRP